MAMIEVQHLRKNFVKTVKEPGLKGALRSFIHPEKQTFEAVKDLTFEVPKGQILGFIGANGAGKSTTIKMLTGILKPTSGFVGLTARFPRIIAKIMSGYWSRFRTTHPAMVGFGSARDLHGFERDLWCTGLAFHKRMDFWMKFWIWRNLSRIPVWTLST